MSALAEPRSWLLFFERQSGHPLAKLFCWRGRYRHVFAAGYVVQTRTWVIYSVEAGGTRVAAACVGDEWFAWLKRCVERRVGVLRVDALPSRRMPWFTFWCVPAIRHLIGMPGGALRPDALWRDCIANGAEVVFDADAPAPDGGNGAGESPAPAG